MRTIVNILYISISLTVLFGLTLLLDATSVRPHWTYAGYIAIWGGGIFWAVRGYKHVVDLIENLSPIFAARPRLDCQEITFSPDSLNLTLRIRNRSAHPLHLVRIDAGSYISHVFSDARIEPDTTGIYPVSIRKPTPARSIPWPDALRGTLLFRVHGCSKNSKATFAIDIKMVR